MTVKKKTAPDWYKINNRDETPEILIYGYIGPFEEVDFVSFQSAIKNMGNQNKSVTVRIHSGGGSVIDGLPIYDSLRTSGMQITTIIEGMAASMASVLSQAGDVRKIHENGMIMIHRVKGAEYGNADDLRAYADLVDGMEKRIKQIFVSKTSQTPELVNSWFSKNTDLWIDANEALRLGLVDEIIKDEKQSTQKQSITNIKKHSEESAFQILTNSLKQQNPNNPYVTSIKIEGDEVQNLKRSRADLLINMAIEAGKISDKKIDVFHKMAVEDYETTSQILNEMQGKPKNVIVNIGTIDTSIGQSNLEDRSQWTLSDYRKKDPYLLEADPELYQKLIDKEFKNK